MARTKASTTTRSPTIQTRTSAPPPTEPASSAEHPRSARGARPTPSAVLRWTRPILPGRFLLGFEAPSIAAGARAGQFVDVLTGDLAESIIRHPYPIALVDRVAAQIAIHVDATTRSGRWLSRAQLGDSLPVFGPLGRGFEIDPRAHHLLFVAEEDAIGSIRMLMDESLAVGRRVTLLLGTPSAAGVYPSSLLPAEVEYVVATEDGSLGHAGSVLDLVPAYEAWADQAFAAGSLPFLAGMAKLAAGRDRRLGVARLGRKSARRSTVAAKPRRSAWLQVSVEQLVGCATATCLGCVIPGVESPVRTCREGPVFAAHELALPGSELTE
jgi:dihydroorotate dehydrogenase electron transfer subunit